jgi:hypothetical protein
MAPGGKGKGCPAGGAAPTMGGGSVCAIGATPVTRAPGTECRPGTGMAFGMVGAATCLEDPELRARSAVLNEDVGVGMGDEYPGGFDELGTSC